MTRKRKRGKCPVCLRSIVLRSSGQLIKHPPTSAHKRSCTGSGKNPVLADGPPPWLSAIELRKKLGPAWRPVTQDELARLLDISVRTLSRLEQRDEEPSGPTRVVWGALQELAREPRKLTVEGQSLVLHQHLKGPITPRRRRQLWKEIL